MKIGFLPLYISLYDQTNLHDRPVFEEFYNELAGKFEAKGIEVVKSEICTEDYQFEREIKAYEDNNCDAIVTLHLAYSPGLNSEKALKNTNLPIIICDSTRAFDFSDNQTTAEVMYCHGIHGVMDMCNLLKRNKKIYTVVAGHSDDSALIDRITGFVKAAKAANSLKGAKVGSIGGWFDGMGDFRIEDKRMEKLFGAKVVYPKKGELKEIAESVTEEEINALESKYNDQFEFIEEVDKDVYHNSLKADITLKKWVENNKLDAFTVNFLKVDEMPTMPFAGICNLMAEKYGYAGEGDTLTALFTGALFKGFENTSFVEIFCPDWKNDTLYLSHMGEMNLALADRKPTAYTKGFPYGECPPPVVATACYKPGNAVFVNIFEDENGFNLFISPVEVLKETTDLHQKNIRGWIDFKKPINEVLEKISMCGATHHSILVYDAKPCEIEFFAKCAGVNPIVY